MVENLTQSVLSVMSVLIVCMCLCVRWVTFLSRTPPESLSHSLPCVTAMQLDEDGVG